MRNRTKAITVAGSCAGAILVSVVGATMGPVPLSDTARLDRAWLAALAGPGAAWDERAAVARLGPAVVSGESTFGSRTRTRFHFASVSATVVVDDGRGTVVAVEDGVP